MARARHPSRRAGHRRREVLLVPVLLIYAGTRVPEKICQPSAVLATKLKMM